MLPGDSNYLKLKDIYFTRFFFKKYIFKPVSKSRVIYLPVMLCGENNAFNTIYHFVFETGIGFKYSATDCDQIYLTSNTTTNRTNTSLYPEKQLEMFDSHRLLKFAYQKYAAQNCNLVAIDNTMNKFKFHCATSVAHYQHQTSELQKVTFLDALCKDILESVTH